MLIVSISSAEKGKCFHLDSAAYTVSAPGVNAFTDIVAEAIGAAWTVVAAAAT